MKTKRELEQKVEDLGVVMEQFRFSPIEGRVFAYLLLADPPAKSFEEIMEFLKASKGSISNALNRFMNEGTITYRTYSGDRKRYFMIDLDGWRKKLEGSAMALTAFSKVMEDILEFRNPDEHIEFVNKLRHVLEFQVYLSDQIVLAIKHWNSK